MTDTTTLRPSRPLAHAEDLKQYILDVPDFPKPGIMFKDITPLLADPAALSMAVELLTQPFRRTHVDLVVGAESRGFIFAMTVARNLSAGFVPVRKAGKLPRRTRRATYALEYGTDTLEVHEDAFWPGCRVLLVDDLLATGGTMRACLDLVTPLKIDVVGAAFLIELGFLDGRPKMAPHQVHAVLSY